MKNSKMKRLALAVGAVLGGIALAPSAQAVHVAQDGLGQAMVFPYYTVREGWQTLFHITNTSSTDIVAVKVRFQESYNSRDVFDMNVILSPNDVWTAWVSDSPNGPVINTVDRSCTTDIIPAGGQVFPTPSSYVGPARRDGGPGADGGPEAIDRMREGYIEVIMMGTANVARLTALPTNNPARGLLLGAVHNAITGAPPTAAACGALAAAFRTNVAGFIAAPNGLKSQFGYPDAAAPNGLKSQFGYPDANGAVVLPDTTQNPLKGSFSLVNTRLGWSAGGTPVTWANFWVPPAVGVGINQNLLAMQASEIATAPAGAAWSYRISWHEPSLNATNTQGVVLTNAGARLASVGPDDADAIGFTIQHTNVINEWSRRTDPQGWTTDTDWVITFPTKRFYVDIDPTNPFAGWNNLRAAAPTGLPAGRAPFTQDFVNRTAPQPIFHVFNGQSCDSFLFNIYNREEGPGTGTGFSPGINPELCSEANVLTFDRSNILKARQGMEVASLNGLPGEAGWLNLVFGLGTVGNPTLAATGRPVVGFQITVRNTGNSSLNEAMIFNHSYSRTYP